MELQAYILCRVAEKSSLYRDWIDDLAINANIVDEPLSGWTPPEDAGIVITHMHYRWEELSALRRCREMSKVPILILADGILEYRNTWQHPDLADGSMFQPCFGHKVACIGRGQARLIAAWGNPNVCEVVGMPRFDQIKPLPPRADNRSKRILIATATTPAFDAQQHDRLVQSLFALKDWAAENQVVNDTPLEIEWRITPSLADAIGVDQDSLDDRVPMLQAIQNVDAVITSPSTVYLESALHQRPVAVLDFHNLPQFVPAAWTLTSETQIDSVIAELVHPPAARMQFQNFILRDQLELQLSAKKRMLKLVEAMIAAGIEARVNDVELKFPSQIVPCETRWDPLPDLAKMFPDNSVFQQADLQRLQIELSAAKARLEQLPTELALKNAHITKLLENNNRMRNRVRTLHGNLKKMRIELGYDLKASEEGESDATI